MGSREKWLYFSYTPCLRISHVVHYGETPPPEEVKPNTFLGVVLGFLCVVLLAGIAKAMGLL
jgi:hypothetical protein